MEAQWTRKTSPNPEHALSPPRWKEGVQYNPSATRALAGLLRKKAALRLLHGPRCRQVSLQGGGPSSALMGGAMLLGSCITSIPPHGHSLFKHYCAGICRGTGRDSLTRRNILPAQLRASWQWMLCSVYLTPKFAHSVPTPRSLSMYFSLALSVPSRLLTSQPSHSLLPRNQGISAPHTTSTSTQS